MVDYAAAVSAAFSAGSIGRAIKYSTTGKFDDIKQTVVKMMKNIDTLELYEIMEVVDEIIKDKDYVEDEPEIKIVRSKRFGIKPMNAEEACIQMELLQHNFYVFFNSDTEEVNVVYKRKGNTYGLIEPELD